MEISPITPRPEGEREQAGPESTRKSSPRDLIIEAATAAQKAGLKPERVLEEGRGDLMDLGFIPDDRPELAAGGSVITYNPRDLAPFTPARQVAFSILGAQYRGRDALGLESMVGSNPGSINTLLDAAYSNPGIVDARVQKVILKARDMDFIRGMYGEVASKLDDESVDQILKNNPRVSDAVNEKFDALREDPQNGDVTKAEVLLEELIGISFANDFNPEFYYEVIAGHEAYQNLVKKLKLSNGNNGQQNLPPALTEIGQRLLHLRRAFEANIDDGVQQTAERAGSTADLRGTIAQLTVMRSVAAGLEASKDPETKEIAQRLKNGYTLALAQGMKRHPGAPEWANFTEKGTKKVNAWVELPGGPEAKFPDNNANS